ncbi:hypothetical protein OROGR_004524 [Orobanche gracilis]
MGFGNCNGVETRGGRLVAPPEIFYDDDTARKYTSNSRIIEIQESMSERALELLNLPNDGVPKLLLDIGCGSGLIGETITGNDTIGLVLTLHPQCLILLWSVRLRATLYSVTWASIQWLCNADKSSHNSHLRLKAFFTSLYRCFTNGARAVFQVYPENDDQRALMMSAAKAAGFGRGLLKDYPDNSKKRKEFLVLTCGQQTPLPKGKAEDDDNGGEENQTVYITDRHRPRKKQKNNNSEKGRE